MSGLTRRRVGRRLAYPSPPSVRRRGRGVASLLQSLRHIPSPPGLLSTIDTRRVLCRSAYTADCNCSLYSLSFEPMCVWTFHDFVYVCFTVLQSSAFACAFRGPSKSGSIVPHPVSQNTGTHGTRAVFCVYTSPLSVSPAVRRCVLTPVLNDRSVLCSSLARVLASPRASHTMGPGWRPHTHTRVPGRVPGRTPARSLSLMHRTLIVRLQSGA